MEHIIQGWYKGVGSVQGNREAQSPRTNSREGLSLASWATGLRQEGEEEQEWLVEAISSPQGLSGS